MAVNGSGKVSLEITSASVAYDDQRECVGADAQQTCHRLKVHLNHWLNPLEQEEEVELSTKHAELDLFDGVFSHVAIIELDTKVALGYCSR